MPVESRPLEDWGRFVSGGTPSTDVAMFWGGAIPWISASSLRTFELNDSDRRLTPSGAAHGARMVPAGSVLFVIRGMSLKSEFRVGIATRDLAFGQDCKALVPNPGVSGRYLAHALAGSEHLVMPMVDEASHGTGRLDMGVLRALRLFHPSVLEQERIAEILDTLDEAIRKTEQVIEKLQQAQQGLLHDLLTRGIDENGELRDPERHPEQFKDSELGRVPLSWAVERLGSVSDVVRGSTPRPAKDPRYFDGDDTPWITVGELSRDDSPFLHETTSKLTELGTRFSRRLEVGTVVLSNSGFGCGVPKILGLSGCANDGIAAFLGLAESVVPLFLYYYLRSQTVALRTRVARGNDQPNLNTDLLRGVGIPMPSTQEQEFIVGRATSLEDAMRVENRLLEKLRLQKFALMHDLLTGRVRTTPP